MQRDKTLDRLSRTAALPGPVRVGSLTLPEAEVQAWCLGLDLPAEDVAACLSVLSPDERARAERFSFEKDRDHFSVARGLLRTLLGGYLGEEPSRIRFAYGPQGKPALAADGRARSLEFSLSHSGDLAAYAFGRDRRLGIDLERVRPVLDLDRLAGRFFAPDESDFVRPLRGERKLAAFFRIWTCKEAVLKARGDGLTRPMTQTRVSPSEAGPVRLVSVDGDEEGAARWRLESFAPVPGYRAALAVEGHDWQFAPQTGGESYETHR